MTRQSGAGQVPAGEHVIERAFKILAVFGAVQKPLSLTSLSVRSGIPKTTALRLVRTLVHLGALERQADGDYAIGLKLLEFATLAPRGHGIRAQVLPHMEELRSLSGKQVVLAVNDGTEAILVERLSTRCDIVSPYRVGGRIPLHTTALGQCLLAHSSSALQERVLGGDLPRLLGEDGVVCPADLRVGLAAIRKAGVAVVHRSRPEPCVAIAGPVFGTNGEIVASLGVTTSDSFDLKALRSLVIRACRQVSEVVAA